jgi:ligand-binding SRPBCC domain-containing protein
MKIYTLYTEQFLPVTREEAWEFLSSPGNLAKITPSDMGFQITSFDGKPMYAGQVICYTVSGLPGLKMNWVTEITHVQQGEYFVDEQRFGPYKLWHHKHFLEPAEGGILMKDVVHYALPLGVLGRLMHALMVKRRLTTIFDYRKNALERLFPVPR